MSRFLLLGCLWLALLCAAAAGGAVPAQACSEDRACDDGNPCTDDACDLARGNCDHADNTDPCDDGNACTTLDVCNAGACVGGAPAAGCSACDAVATLPAKGGSFRGETAGVGALAGSCGASDTSPERVYAWTPSSTGVASIRTCGPDTQYDTVVYLRSSSCAAGGELACSDDSALCTIASGLPHGSSLAVYVRAGETYYIVVDGYFGGRGRYRLDVDPPSRCGDGVRQGIEECDGADAAGCAGRPCGASCACFPSPVGLPDLVPGLADVSLQLGATVPLGDVAEGCASATSNVDLLRFSTEAHNRGTAPLVLGDPQCPSPCSEHPWEVCGNPDFTCGPAGAYAMPRYANYARFELLDANRRTVMEGQKHAWCLHDQVSCPDRLFDTCSYQGLTPGCSDVYRASYACQYLDVTMVPSGDYVLQVRLDPFGHIAEADESNNVLELPVSITRPSDVCGHGVELPAAGGTFEGATAGSSGVAGSCGGSGGSPEAIFLWTPRTSGVAEISTCGGNTSYDTVLHLWSGSCSGGNELGCNDDTVHCDAAVGAGRGSRLTPTVSAGQTYTLVVDGYAGSAGAFTLRVVAPPDGTEDGDGDGIADFEDNCPTHANAGQDDGDTDGVGDLCDAFCAGVPTTITALAPRQAPAGAFVTVEGTGFGPNAQVTLGGVATEQLRGQGRIAFRVPDAAASGSVLPVAVVNPEGCRSQEAAVVTVAAPGGIGSLCGLLGIEPLAVLLGGPLLRRCGRRSAPRR